MGIDLEKEQQFWNYITGRKERNLMDDLNEIKAALEARIDSLKEEMRKDWLSLEERIATLEAQRDEAENASYAHERALESRDRDIARLQEYARDVLQRDIDSLKSEVERTRRGW